MTKAVAEFADKLNLLIPEIMRGFSKYQTNELFKGKITLPQFIILGSLAKQKELKKIFLRSIQKKLFPMMTAFATSIRIMYCKE